MSKIVKLNRTSQIQILGALSIATILSSAPLGAQEANQSAIDQCTALGSSEQACETSTQLNTSASAFLQGNLTRETFSAYVNGVARETTELFEETAEQFAFNANMSPEDATIAGGHMIHVAMNCSAIIDMDSVTGTGMMASEIATTLFQQVTACVNALELITTSDDLIDFGGSNMTLSEEFQNTIEPLDVERAAIIQAFAAQLDCGINGTERACAVARRLTQ